MGTYRIRQVKKEIRVLGLAARQAPDGHGFDVVGVIYRGRHWLDGVLRTTSIDSDVTSEAVEMIVGSDHNPQIRVILLHTDLLKDGTTIDPSELSKGTLKPVIAMRFKETPKDDPSQTERVPLDLESSIAFGLEKRVAERILESTSRESSPPEALRVAELILSSLL